MNTIKKYRHQLNKFLQKIRHKVILENLTSITLYFIRFFPIFIIFTLILENIFYLRPDFRKIMFLSYPTLFVISIVLLIFQYLAINYGILRRYNVKNIAKIFIQLHDKLGNRFLDSIQLLDALEIDNYGVSSDLILESVRTTIDELKPISLKNIIHKKILLKNLRNTGITLVIVVSIFLLNLSSFSSSYNRIHNFNKKFPIPTPFSITTETGDIDIFGGDTVYLNFLIDGELPEELNIDLNYEEFSKTQYIKIDSTGKCEFPLFSMTKDVKYEAYVLNRSIFKPWKKITSGLHSIKVKDRPEIMDVTTKIKFPEYTGIGEKIKESNNSEYFVMPGSKIFISAKLNKPVATAKLDFKLANDIEMTVQGNQLFADFTVVKSKEYRFTVTDANGISNINPITYKIKITPDNFPAVNLMSPREDFQLSELMEVPIHLRISDDFGFSKAFIHYKLLKKFGERNNEERDVVFPLEHKDVTLQEITYSWDVNSLGLAPEDGVEFFIEVYDNDIIYGPKKATTRKVTAFFPSLNDLFSSIAEEQEKVEESGEEILDKLLSSKEVLKDISNEMLKDPNLTWEQKEQLQQEMKKTMEAGKDLQDLSEQLKEIQKQGEENQLFSEETIKKYSELQEAMQNLMSPELKKAMQELQKAIDNNDQKNMEKAMEKFQTTHDEFSEELDRMLQLMKHVQIEQAVDELVKRIDDLTKRQDSVTQNLKKNTPEENKEWNALQKEEKNIEKDTRIFEDQLEKTAEMMQEFPMMNPEALENMQQEMNESGLYDDMENSQKSMQMRESESAQNSSQQAKDKLSDLQEQMQEFQEQFQQSNMDDVASDFRSIIMKTLQLSQMQEALNKEVSTVSRKSEQLVALAKQQNRYRNNLSHLIKDLTELSQKTFGLSSQSTKEIGEVANEMQGSMKGMTDRNPHSARHHGNKAKASLNKLSLSLMKSLQELEESGESSGFQNYMEQMEQLAQQQQRMNQQTQQKGQGMPKPQPGGTKPGSQPGSPSFQQLAARQKQIQQSLQQLGEQIQQDSQNQAGTLKGIAKDMDEVLKDLQNNAILRKTIDRQQKILTRMLDAQKSLRTQSYKKERESTTGKDMTKIPPGELPEDFGERNLVLRQRLEEALKNGYTTEYKKIIRKYFEELSKEENKVEE